MEIYNDREAVFAYLMNCDLVIKLSVGAVLDGQVHHDYVVIHAAPAKAVSVIVGNFHMVSLTPEGLLIPLAPQSSTAQPKEN